MSIDHSPVSYLKICQQARQTCQGATWVHGLWCCYDCGSSLKVKLTTHEAPTQVTFVHRGNLPGMTPPMDGEREITGLQTANKSDYVFEKTRVLSWIRQEERET